LSAAAIGEWYARASIYALPARYEPFGLSVLEAASAGCALVLGDIPSLRENWDGAALFVPPDDHCALTAAINDLINDPRRRALLAQGAVTRASRFSLGRMVDEYAALYDVETLALSSTFSN
jgi:glycosyltransferase involved in cell wall biosynthesis